MIAISVVIPTTGSTRLSRALTSVEHQDFSGPLEVVVVTTDTDRVRDTAGATIASMSTPCRVISLKRDQASSAANPLLDIYPWAASARLRNAGIATAQGTFIAHLDDDNEFVPNHLSTLFKVLEQSPDAPAAFSWRRLFFEDSTPFTANVYPWMKQPNLAQARYIFDRLVEYGVFRRDCCEMHDQYISEGGEQLLTVDTSEWLIRRAFHLRFQFTERLTFREVSHGATDDYLFCKQLAEAGIRVARSEHASLNYYLGGRTTSWLNDTLREPQR